MPRNPPDLRGRVAALTEQIDELEERLAELREERRLTMMRMVEEGWGYAAIGRLAGLSRDRVRRIVEGGFSEEN